MSLKSSAVGLTKPTDLQETKRMGLTSNARRRIVSDMVDQGRSHDLVKAARRRSRRNGESPQEWALGVADAAGVEAEEALQLMGTDPDKPQSKRLAEFAQELEKELEKECELVD